MTPSPLLTLSESPLLTDAGVKTIGDIVGSCLTTLILNDCPQVHDASLDFIVTCCPNIKTLNVAGKTKLIIINFVKIILGCYGITCSGLSTLKGSTTLYDLDCGEIPFSDEGLVHIFGIQNLAILGISECYNLHLDNTSCLPTTTSLRSLCVRSVPSVSDTTLSVLIKKTPNLKILDCSFCGKLGDKSLLAMATSALSTSLTSLNVWGSNVTDEGIANLTR